MVGSRWGLGKFGGRSGKRAVGIAAAFTVALVLAGCGSDGDDSAADDGSGTKTVRVSLIPGSDLAPLYVGQKQGFFEDQGIKLEITTVQSGALAAADVQSGNADVAFGVSSVAVAGAAQGLPLQIIGAVSYYPTADHGTSEVIVRDDSDIQDFSDLTGKTVAIGLLKSSPELAMRAKLDEAGVDADSVSLQAVPFPDMVGALVGGQVDAALTAEPFLGAALADPAGIRSIGSPYTVYADDPQPAAVALSDSSWLKDNEDLAARFVKALNESTEYTAGHEDEARAVLPSFTGLDAAVAAKIALPDWSQTAVDLSALESAGQAMKDYGWVPKAPSSDEMVWKGASTQP